MWRVLREKKSVLVQPPLFKHHCNVSPTNILILVLPHLKIQVSRKTILSYPLLFGDSVSHNPSVTVEKCQNIVIQAHSGVVLNGSLWRLKYQYLNPCSCTEYEYTKIEFECRVAAAVSSAQPGGKCAVTFCSQIYATVNHPMNWLQSPFTMEEY